MLGLERAVGRNADIGRLLVALLYAKGGYSNGKLKIEEFLTEADPSSFGDYDSSSNGFHVGGGLEVPFQSRTHFRADYVYPQYEKFDVGSTEQMPFSRNQLWAAVGLRF